MGTAFHHTSSGNARSTAFARDPFDRYRKEELVEVRRADVKGDKVIARFREIWRKWDDENVFNETFFRDITRDVVLSAKDISKICIALAEFEDDGMFYAKSGKLLSDFMNNSPDFIFNRSEE